MITTRDATPADNPRLLALAEACPMVGDLSICVERNPDFFALNRLEGERWRVGIAEAANHAVAGCVAVAERRVYLFGAPATTNYVGDLKVHPEARGGGSASALITWAREASRQYGGDDRPALLTILANNRAMERLTQGRGGLPRMDRFATIRIFAVPLVVRRRPADQGLRISTADAHDVEEMLELWQRVAPERQFAPVLDAERFSCWLARAPGLALHDYWLARDATGRLAGFVALWEQSAFKRTRVLAYSKRLAAVRCAINALACLTRGPALPAPGEPLRTATLAHLCVPASRPEVLHALLRRIHDAARPRGLAFFALGLDRNDPLCAALAGLLAQPTDVNAWITAASGRYRGPALDDRPLYHDIALV